MRHIRILLSITLLAGLLVGCASNDLELEIEQPKRPRILRRDGTPLPEKYLAAIEHDILNQTLATINFMELRTRGKYVTAEKYDRLAAPLYDLLAQAKKGDAAHEWSLRADAGDEGELFAAQRMILLHGLSQIFHMHERYRGRLPTEDEITSLIQPFLEVER